MRLYAESDDRIVAIAKTTPSPIRRLRLLAFLPLVPAEIDKSSFVFRVFDFF